MRPLSTAPIAGADGVMPGAYMTPEHARPHAEPANSADRDANCGNPSTDDAQVSTVRAVRSADLTVAHSAECGTTIRGDTRRWSQAIRALGGWRWLPGAEFWYRLRSRGTATPSVPLDRWADRLRARGATVAVEDVVPCTDDESHAIRARIAGERAEKLTGRAARARANAGAHAARANAVLSAIPMGQPILVGHHSERRHRRDLARAESALVKAHESSEYADRLTERAARQEAIATAVVDPNAGAVRDALCARIRKNLKRDVGAVSVVRSSALRDSSIYWIRFPARDPVQVRVTDAGADVLVALSVRARLVGTDCYDGVVQVIRAMTGGAK